MAAITIYPSAMFTDSCGRLILATDVEFAPGFCLAAGDKFLQFEQADPSVVRQEFAESLNPKKLRFYRNISVSDEITDDFPLIAIDGLLRKQEEAKAEGLGEMLCKALGKD